MSAREKMIAAKLKRQQNLAAAEKEEKKVVVKKQPKKKKTIKKIVPVKSINKTVTIEIDWAAFEQFIKDNCDSNKTKDESVIFNRVFKPYKTSITGKDYYLYQRMGRVLTKNAKLFVKKVIREDVI